MNRFDGRKTDELRPVKIIKDFTRYAEGSVLIEWGNTKVLCNASVEESVPPFKKGSGEGWVRQNIPCCLAQPQQETKGTSIS